ncbi:MFS transporter [Streptomyces gobiensis]|uniref:MFS transporter n=1 Tax=Streptomyces gobiensis TaxID=2875706 RepID=UPI001E4A16F5|nr:MFS transporter [Streptomyces gobiensis]UGY94323.1 MFS transporter [Streptomyces gobiensis]
MILGTLRTIAGLNRDLRTLFVTTLLFRSGTMAFPFLAVYLLGQDRYRPAEIGLIVGVFGVGALLADLSASLFLGRVRPSLVMVAGSVVYALVLVVLPLLSGLVVLVGATLLWGMAYEVYTPAAYAQVVASSPPSERKVAFSCHRLAINLGMGIGPAIGGLLFAVAPVALFYINAACVLAAAVILWLYGPSATPLQHSAAERVRLVSPTPRGELQFWTIFSLAIPVHVAYALPPILLSAYIIEGLGLPAYWASVVFVVNAAAIVLFEVPLNKAMASMSHARSLLIGFGLAGAGFALMGVTAHGVLLALITLVWTAGEMIVFPSLLSYVSHLSDRSVANRNVGLYSAGANIGFIAAPQIGLVLTSDDSPGTPWLVTGLAVGAAFALMLGSRLSEWTWHSDERQETAPGQPAPAASHRSSENNQV